MLDYKELVVGFIWILIASNSIFVVITKSIILLYNNIKIIQYLSLTK
jgi:hypothetical protein